MGGIIWYNGTNMNINAHAYVVDGGSANAFGPCLRQHARNPEDWLPWGDAVFARATCHA